MSEPAEKCESAIDWQKPIGQTLNARESTKLAGASGTLPLRELRRPKMKFW